MLVVFDGVQTLDLTGPAEVFATANREVARMTAAARKDEERRSSDDGLRRADDVLLRAGDDLRRADDQLRRADDGRRLANVGLRRADDQLRRADDHLRRADAGLRRADDKLRRADDKRRRADDKLRRADDMLRRADAGLRRADGNVRRPDTPYEIVIASRAGGELVTSCGLPIRTVKLESITPRATDTVLVAGGGKAPITNATGDGALLRWLARAATIVRRIGSVCSGAFVLAAAGLLDGKRAATHWSACDPLARLFPRVEVDRNAIFVIDGNVWTSAGVTTGIDMSLAIVEDDLGRDVADAIAAQLVLYMRRPGYQSQWSDALVARDGAAALAPAIAWARANLANADLETVAQKAGLSLRTFHRRCLEQLSTTPAKLIEKLRVERARDLVESGDLPAKALAAQCGFSSAVQMKRAFERELGVGPRAYRLLHRA